MPSAGDPGVYFVECGDGGPIKIGIARDPARRLDQLQVGCPWKLRMLVFIRCGGRALQLERQLHEAFADGHLRGEWFSPAIRPRVDAIATIVQDEFRRAMQQVFGL